MDARYSGDALSNTARHVHKSFLLTCASFDNVLSVRSPIGVALLVFLPGVFGGHDVYLERCSSENVTAA